MLLKAAFHICSLIISLSFVAGQDDKELTAFFQGFINEKQKDISGTELNGLFGAVVKGIDVRLNEIKVIGGFNKQSVNGLSVTQSYKEEVYHLKLTFELKKGSIAAPKVTVYGEEYGEQHHGQYEASFESAQFEVKFRFYDAKAGRNAGRTVLEGVRVLWSTGVKQAWVGFDVDIKELLDDHDEIASTAFSNTLFDDVAASWWRDTLRDNGRHIMNELPKVLSN